MWRFNSLLFLSFGEFSDFIRESFREKSKLSDDWNEEFFDFRKPSGKKIENETIKEGLFGTF